ncbi:MAG: hypothetical protein JW739_08680 [Opitutales bacterium]|nr:hypothetical protein [Opitutales bacterium]
MNKSILLCATTALLSACTSTPTSNKTERPAPTTVESIFGQPLKWTASAPVVLPKPDDAHNIVSVKDPSVVHYNGKWHVYATTADTEGHWSMQYTSFTDWKEASKAEPYYLDQTPGLDGYHCAPHVFYFTPQKKWYMVYQSQQPQFSTTDDLSDPESWTAPENFFENSDMGGLRLDYWIICDKKYAYLFATGDDGNVYRSKTKLENFPKGMSPFEVIISGAREDIFEAGMTFKIKGMDKYLTLVEAIGPARYYRAWIADTLDGDWSELEGANTWKHPFAGMNNVRFEPGVTPWTTDISHGELIREGYDEIPTIDPAHLTFLFQGFPPEDATEAYHMLPYRLGLLTQDTEEQ